MPSPTLGATKHGTTLSFIYFFRMVHSVTHELWLELAPKLVPLCSLVG